MKSTLSLRKKSKKDWLIVFLVQAGNENINHVKNMIDDAIISYSPNNIFHLCIDAPKKAILTLDASLRKKLPADMDDQDTGVFQLEIKYRSCTREIILDYITVDRVFNITNGDDVGRYLKGVWTLNKANRVMMVTWDHGNFFGIFNKSNKKNPIFTNGEYDALLPGSMDRAFKSAFGRKKISLLLMMNCNTNVINFAFSLQHSVKNMVAAPTAMELSGYNFKRIFLNINSHPRKSSKIIAMEVIQDQAKVNTTPQRINWPHIEVNDNELLLVALSLRYINRMTLLLDNIVRHLVARIKNDSISKEAMIHALASVTQIATTTDDLREIDFQSLIDRIAEIVSHSVSWDIKQLRRYLQKSVIGYYAGAKMKLILENAGLSNPAFSTYFVPSQEVFKTSPEYLDFIRESSRNAIEYSKARLWDDFMSFLYSDEPQPGAM